MEVLLTRDVKNLWLLLKDGNIEKFVGNNAQKNCIFKQNNTANSDITLSNITACKRNRYSKCRRIRKTIGGH